MKILMVNKFLYMRGGAETYVWKIGEKLKEQGHEVQYYGTKDPANIMKNQYGIYMEAKDFRAKSIKNLTYPFSIIWSRQAYRQMQQLIRRFKPDIIHLNNINFHLTPSIIEAAAREGVTIVQTVHDAQMVCPSHMMMDLKKGIPCQECLSGNLWPCTKKKCVHGSGIKSLLATMEGYLYRRKKTYAKVDRFICPSHFMEEIVSHGADIRGRTQVILNYSDLQATSLPDKEDYILFFGRFAEEKGILRLLEVVRKMPEINFVFAGSGPLEEEVKKAARELDNLKFTGFLSGEQLHQTVEKALLSLSIPIWPENCPFSVIESISCGTPVLGAKIGGIPELIEDGKTGVLLENADTENICQALRKLKGDKELLKKMAENCIHDSVIPSLDEYVKRVEEVYGELLAAKK